MASYACSLTTTANSNPMNFTISTYYSRSPTLFPLSTSTTTSVDASYNLSSSYNSVESSQPSESHLSKKDDPLQQFETSRIKLLQEERLHIQKKTFTKWINSFLNKARLEVFDLFTDLSDGKMLLKLLEIISGEKLGKPCGGQMRLHKVENVNKALAFLHTKVRLESIGAEDIVDGNPRLILGLIWTIILRFHIQEIEICLDEENESSEKKSAKDALLLWCQRKTAGYRSVDISDFTASWRNGMGFNALIHSHRPDMIDYKSLDARNHVDNLNNAFKVAHEDLGVAPILDAEDVDTNKPDEKSIITYVASYYHTFARMRDEMKGGRRIANIMTRMKDVDDSKLRFGELMSALLEWIRNKIVELNDRNFPNSLDGIQRFLIEFKTYRTVEKPPKYMKCSEIEALFFSINASLKTLNQPIFIPKEGHMLKDIEREWQNLVKAEHKREVALREELMRQEGLEHLAFKFEKKSVLRTGYLEEMIQVLSDSRYGSNLAQVDATVKKHEAISADILAREDRFEDLIRMSSELEAENYHGKDSINKKVDAILSKWRHLLMLLGKHKETLLQAHLLITLLREADTMLLTINELKVNLSSEDIGGFLLAVEDLIHKHALMESQVNSIGETMKRLNKQGTSLISSASGHKDIPLLDKKLNDLSQEYIDLVDVSRNRKSRLEDARRFYQFEADMKEEEAWVVEKQRICRADVTAKDLRSVVSLIQKHKALEDEMRTRRPKSENVIRSGEVVTSKGLVNANSVKEEITLLRNLWTQLDEFTLQKKKQLTDAAEAFSLVADANEVESWIKEKLPLVKSTDFGVDELGARSLLQLNSRLEGEIRAYDVDIKALNALGRKLIKNDITSLHVVSQNEVSQEKSEQEVNSHGELVPEEYWEEVETERVEEHIVLEDKMMNVVKAKYSFEGQGMSMAKGEEMILLSKTNDDWWNVRKTTGEEGFVPANYVREVTPRLIKVKVKRLKKTPIKQRVKRSRLVTVNKERPKPPPRRRTADDCETVEKKLDVINQSYEELTKLASRRTKLLEDSIKFLAFERECSSFQAWMKEKEKMLSAESDLEAVEVAKRKFEQFLTDMFAANKRKEGIDKMVSEMASSNHSQMNKVKTRQDEIHDYWDRLNRLKQRKEKTLEGASSVELFHRTCDEATEWMVDKSGKVDADEFGRDLKTIKALQRKHDQLERELAPIEEKVNQVKTFASSVKTSYPNETKVVESREAEILELWQKLRDKASGRRNRLEEAVGKEVFVNACDDLFEWIQEVKRSLNTSETAKDVSTAENLLENQNELGNDIRAHRENFQELRNLGLSLIQRNPKFTDIKNKLSSLVEEESAISRGWQEKGDWLRQCLDLQLFNREADNIDAATRSHVAFLEHNDLGATLDEVETLLKRHDDFENTLVAQDERLRTFNDMASKLISASHYDGKYIDDRRNSVLLKRNDVKEESQERRSLLDKSMAYQQFKADSEDFSKWMTQKSKKVDDESYKDLSNLERKLQKHEAFSRELFANEGQLRRLTKSGEDLVTIYHYRSKDIRETLNSMNSQWADLTAMAREKEVKLKQAVDESDFNKQVEHTTKCIEKLDSSFSQVDVGSDLRSCKELLKKQKTLEADMTTVESKISELRESEQNMTQYGHFDSVHIIQNYKTLQDRLQMLSDPCKNRRAALEESLKFHQFKFQVDAESQWISEHRPFILSEVLGYNLYEAQKLIKKHQKFTSEISGHYPQIEKTLNRGTELIEEKHSERKQIEELCTALRQAWDELNALLEERRLKLEVSLKEQYYFFEANEIEAWLNEKWILLQSKDYGKDENVARKILTKHKALELEIDTYEGLVNELGIKAECMIKANHPESKLIKEKQQLIRHDLLGVQKGSTELRQKLMQSMYKHEYFREADELHNWISEQLQIASSDDYGNDYEHLLVLQSRFDDFRRLVEVGSERFSQCTELAKRLISSENLGAAEIEEKQESLNVEWDRLLDVVRARNRKLEEAGEFHRFNRDVAEALSRIQEKWSAASDNDLGRDVHSVQSLIRKHEGLQNDLVALEAQLQVLVDDASQLKLKLSSIEQDRIVKQHSLLTSSWKDLQERLASRGNDLKQAKDFQKFIATSRDLMSWSIDLRSCMKTQEKVRDAASAQALKGDHERLKAEIEAREDIFQRVVDHSKSMFEDQNIYASEIEDRVNKVLEERSQLHSAWQNKKVYLDQLIDLQFFLRDVKQLHSLCLAQEATLSTSELSNETTTEEADALVKKHASFAKVIEAQEEKFQLLNLHGMKLMEQNHFYSQHIKNHSEEVAERRHAVKMAAKKKQNQLEDAHSYAQFIRDVVDANAWIVERRNLIESEKQKDKMVNFEEKMKRLQKHQVFMAEVQAHEPRISQIFEKGNDLVKKGSPPDINKQLQNLKSGWDRLVSDSKAHFRGLEEAQDILEFNTVVEKVETWMKEKELLVQAGDLGSDLEHCLVLKRKLEDVDSNMRVDDTRFSTLNQLADKIISQGGDDVDKSIVKRRKDLNSKWRELKGSFEKYHLKLCGAQEVHAFIRDVDDVKERISEKAAMLSSDETGRNLMQVELLQRKQDSLLCDLTAIEQKVDSHTKIADLLCAKYAGNQPEIQKRLSEEMHDWIELKSAWDRRQKLLTTSRTFHKFGEDVKELKNWQEDVVSRLESVCKPLSITEAELKLQSLEELKMEIGGRSELFESLSSFGEQLLKNSLDVPDDLEHNVEKLRKTKLQVLKCWDDNHSKLSYAHKVLLYDEMCKDVESWLSGKEAHLHNDDLGESISSVESLIRKHEGFEKTLKVHGSKFEELKKMANSLLDENHVESNRIQGKLDSILARWHKLQEATAFRTVKLAQSKVLHQFFRNLLEVEGWIAEKRKVATDMCYTDPTNLLSKMQKHGAFEAELTANAGRIDALSKEGKAMLLEEHYGAKEIKSCIERLQEAWGELLDCSTQKKKHLSEAYQALLFNRNLDDLEAWMDDVEVGLQSEDHGHDLTSVQNLLLKHQRLEVDIASRQKDMDQSREVANSFIKDGHFMSDAISDRSVVIEKRYFSLQDAVQIRKDNLNDSHLLHQLMRDTEEELSWLSEKEVQVSSEDLGSSLVHVQNLLKKHQVIETEIHSHEPSISSLTSRVHQLIRSGHFAAPLVEKKMNELLLKVSNLKDLSSVRRLRLLDAVESQMFYSEASETEVWIKERRPYLESLEFGKDEDSVAVLMKRLRDLQRDMENFKEVIEKLKSLSEKLTSRNHFDSKNIQQRLNLVVEQFETLQMLEEKRFERLRESSELFKFLRHCDSVIEGLVEQTVVAASEDYGQDVEHVEILIQKFESFMSSMTLNEEKVATVNSEAKALIENVHPERERINEKLSEVTQMWDDLKELASARQEALAGAKQVHVYDRDAEETKSWIAEKVAAISTEDYGQDLETIQILTRKHQSFERDLAAVKEQVESVVKEAKRLAELFPDASEHISVKHEETVEAWNDLLEKSAQRKDKLQQAAEIQAYFDEYRELLAWLNEIIAKVTSPELAKEVTESEAIINRHNEYKVEIDSRTDALSKFSVAGQTLIRQKHFMSDDIAEKVSILDHKKSILFDHWETRNDLYKKNHDLRVFLRNVQMIESWVDSRGLFVSDEHLGESIPEVEDLLRRHDDFMKTVEAQEEKLETVKRITLIEEMYKTQKLKEEQAKVVEQQRRERERTESMKRKEVLRITNARKRESGHRGRGSEPDSWKYDSDETENEASSYRFENDSRRYEDGEGGRNLSSKSETHNLEKRDVARTGSMNVNGKKVKRVPSFTTRRRTQSFRKHKKIDDLDNLPPVEMRGYLERKQELQSGGKKATIRSWKLFYTVLCGQLVCFFKDDSDFYEQKAASPPLSIFQAKVEKAEDYTKKKNVFRIITRDAAEYLFLASSEAYMNDWVTKLSFHADLPPSLQLLSYDCRKAVDEEPVVSSQTVDTKAITTDVSGQNTASLQPKSSSDSLDLARLPSQALDNPLYANLIHVGDKSKPAVLPKNVSVQAVSSSTCADESPIYQNRISIVPSFESSSAENIYQNFPTDFEGQRQSHGWARLDDVPPLPSTAPPIRALRHPQQFLNFHMAYNTSHSPHGQSVRNARPLNVHFPPSSRGASRGDCPTSNPAIVPDPQFPQSAPQCRYYPYHQQPTPNFNQFSVSSLQHLAKGDRSRSEIYNEDLRSNVKAYGESWPRTSSLPMRSSSSSHSNQHSIDPEGQETRVIEGSDVYCETDSSMSSKEPKRKGSVFKFLSRKKGANA